MHDSRQILRDHVQRNYRRLLEKRAIWLPHHGALCQRRINGSKSRRIRISRQNLRNQRQRNRKSHRPKRQRNFLPQRKQRRHLQNVPNQGFAHKRLGQIGSYQSQRLKFQGNFLARPRPSPRQNLDWTR